MNNQLLNYELWMDYFLNSWEHFDDNRDAATYIVEALLESKDESQIKKAEKLIEYWVSNESNDRIDIEMNYHKNVEHYEEKMKQLVDRFLKN